MNKSRLLSGFRSIVSASAVLFFVLFFAVGAWAASTIGANMSSTGTFTVTPASDSATSVRFQDTAGTNIFIVNSTSRWVGIGAAPQTTFEVQGTASASYLLTGNTIQVGGYASVAYSRFGTNATTYSGDLSTTNDLLISGNLEVDLKSFFDAPGEFQGTASASYLLTGNTIQVGGFASVAYNRFGIAAATTHSADVTTINDVVINGDLEVDSSTFLDGLASVSGNFEAVGYASASKGFITTSFVVGSNVASSSTVYLAEFSAPSTSASASFIFAGGGTSATTVGTCFQLKSTSGAWIYMRFNQGATSPTLSTIKCHN